MYNQFHIAFQLKQQMRQQAGNNPKQQHFVDIQGRNRIKNKTFANWKFLFEWDFNPNFRAEFVV